MPLRPLRLPPAHLAVAAWRRALARHHTLAPLVRVAMTASVALGAWSASSSIGAARDDWGDTTSVLVANRPLAPGDTLDAEPAQFPLALAPRDALVGADPDTVVRRHVGTGEVLTRADVGDGGGTAALLPERHRAVHVPASSDQRRLLVVGDGVVVVVDGRTVANGTVVAIGEESAAVAVPDGAVAAVADGALRGTATLALGS